jgi:hypothetical protein
VYKTPRTHQGPPTFKPMRGRGEPDPRIPTWLWTRAGRLLEGVSVSSRVFRFWSGGGLYSGRGRGGFRAGQRWGRPAGGDVRVVERPSVVFHVTGMYSESPPRQGRAGQGRADMRRPSVFKSMSGVQECRPLVLPVSLPAPPQMRSSCEGC